MSGHPHPQKGKPLAPSLRILHNMEENGGVLEEAWTGFYEIADSYSRRDIHRIKLNLQRLARWGMVVEIPTGWQITERGRSKVFDWPDRPEGQQRM